MMITRLIGPVGFQVLLPLLLIAEAETRFPVNDEGFYYAAEGVPLDFPRDHGNHPGFAMEWWYITGHLRTDQNSAENRFAFQITFFRRSAPPGSEGEKATQFSDATLFLAHVSLMDLENETFHHQEKLNRKGWNGYAGEGKIDLYNGGWSMAAHTYNPSGDPEVIRFAGSIFSDATLELSFEPVKPRVLFGNNGISRKGSPPDATSLYITFPRLKVRGQVILDNQSHLVSGQAWMDHEVSSNQLEGSVDGWDWVQMQFFDGTEAMGYRLRKPDGSSSSFSFFNWIDSRGEVTKTGSDHFQWIAANHWTSPETGATYPIGPEIRAVHPETGKTMHYRLVPLVKSAEIPGTLGGIAYWEGAVYILDRENNTIGTGFLELTGYARSLSDRL